MIRIRKDSIYEKRRFSVLLSILLIILSVLPVNASEGNGISASPRAIMTAHVTVDSESGHVTVEADLVCSDGYNYIIEVKNVDWISGNGGDVDNVSFSSPVYWKNNSYATVTLTYTYNGVLTTDLVYFYPPDAP